MASLMHKLTRTSPSFSLRTLGLVKATSLREPTPSVFPRQIGLDPIRPGSPRDSLPYLREDAHENLRTSETLHFYPSWPFGLLLNPLSLAASEGTEHVQGNDSTRIWADSVKRKRKRKMNKHKLRKRRKMLRGKSRKQIKLGKKKKNEDAVKRQQRIKT